jgi:hypothetical protein
MLYYSGYLYKNPEQYWIFAPTLSNYALLSLLDKAIHSNRAIDSQRAEREHRRDLAAARAQ